MLIKASQGLNFSSTQSFLSPRLVPAVYGLRHQVNQFDPSRYVCMLVCKLLQVTDCLPIMLAWDGNNCLLEVVACNCQFACSFHEEVAQLLAHMGIAHQLEVTSTDGFFCFDIVAQVSSRDLVIEVDGSSHFAALPPHHVLGGTYIRNTLFAAAGHTGIAIAYFQWERLASLEARQSYLQRKLVTCAEQNAKS